MIFENGRLPKKPGGLINWKLVQSETERLLKVMDVRINPKSKIMHLPMWQRQVVEICKALSQDPKVLILDEPTSALDPISTSKIEELALELKDKYTIVIVTHNMQQAARVSDKTGFFMLGELVEYNDTKKMFLNPDKVQTQNYITGRFG